MREKHNTIQELERKNKELVGDNRLSLEGQGDFTGGNNTMRGTMNAKHKTQHLAIDNPEFPFLYDGKENISGEYSSFYTKTDKRYVVIGICKKFNERLHGKTYFALYFLHCPDDDSYTVVERKEVENLTENFGFTYKNDYLDKCEVGEEIPAGTILSCSTSYDENMNVSVGVNGRIMYIVEPALQDDAIIVSESFAKRMVASNVTTKTIPINDKAILLNLYGNGSEYQGLPNIGDVITDGIVAATRLVKETRMFSDLRDNSLSITNRQSDTIFYCDKDSEVIDIDVYVNKPELEVSKVNKQLVEYYNDAKWFYSEVYRTCRKIIKSGSTNIDQEIHRWMRKAMNYLDTLAKWAFNDNIFSNIVVEILLRKKEPIRVGRKIVGRHGNKTVVCNIWPDDAMPYLTTEYTVDEYGVKHPKGVRERVDLLTNPLAFINRTIPIPMHEGSITFLLDKARKHAATLPTLESKKEFLFDIINLLNPRQGHELEELYATLSERAKEHFIEDCISLNPDGTLRTDNGLYSRWEAFNQDWTTRDAIISVYEKYPDIMKPYEVFVPKKKWGRDIYIGQGCIGYQYIMMLKQSGEKGFSVRSAGAISDESLPEKSHDNKIGKYWCSTKPIRFGEYETPGRNRANFFNCGDILLDSEYEVVVEMLQWQLVIELVA